MTEIEKPALLIESAGALLCSFCPPSSNNCPFPEYRPRVFRALTDIKNLTNYNLILLSPSDVSTVDSSSESQMLDLLIRSFANEGVLLTKFVDDISLSAGSYVVLNGLTSVDFAIKHQLRAIVLNTDLEWKQIIERELEETICFIARDWSEIADYLAFKPRASECVRESSETSIQIKLVLDGSGKSHIATGLAFFDHMLHQLARHSGCDLTVSAKGDLHIDQHHTIEDTALLLGDAFAQALHDKVGIERYGFCLPMDDCIAQVAIDFSGRPWLLWNAEFKREMVGDVPTEMFFHFFKSFCDTAKCNLSISATGENEHHKIEAIFKCFARSIKMAKRHDLSAVDILPSTKGML